MTPLRDVFNTLLRREQPIFSRETHIYFQDVFDHLIRVADTIDTLRDMLGSTMDAYLSISGNRMNMIMKRLTSISTILMSVTLVAGIYGMNFEHMPELGWKFGYVGAHRFDACDRARALFLLSRDQMALMNFTARSQRKRRAREAVSRRHGSAHNAASPQRKSQQRLRHHPPEYGAAALAFRFD